jgi:hypothetical protein
MVFIWSTTVISGTVYGGRDSAGHVLESAFNPIFLQTGDSSNARIGVLFIPKLTAVTTPYTVSLKLTSGANMAIVAVEVSGVGTTGLWPDVVARAASTVSGLTSQTGNSPAAVHADLFVVAAAILTSGGVTMTPEVVSPVWTSLANNSANPFSAVYRVLTSQIGIVQSCSWTHTLARGWAASLVAFRETNGDAPAVVPRISQAPVEIISRSPVAGRVTQSVVEVLSRPNAPAVVTQLSMDLLSRTTPEAVVTQLSVDTLQKNILAPSGGGIVKIWLGDEGSKIWID